MSATESGHRTSKPNRGRWDWRAYGPACRCELDDLRRRALLTDPKGLDLHRFLIWVEAEFAGRPRQGVTQQRNTLAKYRRFLYDLQAGAEPAHPIYIDVTLLPCRLDSVRRETQLNVTEPIAGPWDWQRLIPQCACDLDALRLTAAKAYSDALERSINLGRFLQWVERQAKGEGEQLSSGTLSKYRRFLYELVELNVDHEPAHGIEDVQVQEQRQCAFDRELVTAENPCSLGSVKLVAA